jgi:zinc/manganese transport system permease protein
MFFIYPRVQGLKKEFLFFLMLAITVTSSVQSAGVLVVFSLLIAPSYIGITQKKFKSFSFAIVFGSLAILFALFISYIYDLPTGYTIIFSVVSSSLLGVILYTLLQKNN